MNKDQFISYLTNPAKLNAGTIDELTSLINDFPYFQSARILLTINLFKEENVKFNSELKLTAIYAGNRNILKRHIDRMSKDRLRIIVEEEQKEKPVEKVIPEERKEKPATPVENDQETAKTEPAKTKPTTEENTIAQLKKIIEQRIREIEEEKKHKDQEKSKKPLSKKAKTNLIDSFIENDPSISRSKGEFYDPVVKARQSVVEQEDIVSETLAQIYYDQGYYDKAILMYEKLILKIPEKSSYFAALIQKAKNELNKK